MKFFDIITYRVYTLSNKNQILDLVLDSSSSLRHKLRINIQVHLNNEIIYDKQDKLNHLKYALCLSNDKNNIVYRFKKLPNSINIQYKNLNFDFAGLKLNLYYADLLENSIKELLHLRQLEKVYLSFLKHFQNINNVFIRRFYNKDCYIVFQINSDADKCFEFLTKYPKISKFISLTRFLFPDFFVFVYRISNSTNLNNLKFESFKLDLIKNGKIKRLSCVSKNELILYLNNLNETPFIIDYNNIKYNSDELKNIIDFYTSKLADTILNKDIKKLNLILKKFPEYFNEIENFLKLLNL